MTSDSGTLIPCQTKPLLMASMRQSRAADHSNRKDTMPSDTIHRLVASKRVEDGRVDTGLKGCGKRADTKDVIDFPGRDPKLRGNSDSPQNICGTEFDTFILAERGIRLCQVCRVKLGLIW